MAASAGILSQTLQSITDTKISELRKQREVGASGLLSIFHPCLKIVKAPTRLGRANQSYFQTFATLKSKLLAAVDTAEGPEARVRLLLSEIAGCTSLEDFNEYNTSWDTGDLSLTNIHRFLNQSRYDPSIPQNLLTVSQYLTVFQV